MSFDNKNKKKKNLWGTTERKSTAEVLYPNQLNNAPSELNPVLAKLTSLLSHKVSKHFLFLMFVVEGVEPGRQIMGIVNACSSDLFSHVQFGRLKART